VLYDFYFKAPPKSDFEKQLQVLMPRSCLAALRSLLTPSCFDVRGKQAMANDKFKGLRNWKKVHTELTARKIKSVPSDQAAKLATKVTRVSSLRHFVVHVRGAGIKQYRPARPPTRPAGVGGLLQSATR
jgi:hypothetical protein